MVDRPASIDIGRALDEGAWGPFQKWVVALTALVIIFDGIDNQLLGLAIPSIMKEWLVPRQAFANVAALGFVGMMIGGALGGLVGDRLGRRFALIGSMLTFSVMTAAASQPDWPRLPIPALPYSILAASSGRSLDRSSLLGSDREPP